MFPTIARWFPSARCLKPSLSKKIASLEENQVAVNTVRAVLRKHGPVTINDCWSYAKVCTPLAQPVCVLHRGVVDT